jgi:hypothetical protein
VQGARCGRLEAWLDRVPEGKLEEAPMPAWEGPVREQDGRKLACSPANNSGGDGGGKGRDREGKKQGGAATPNLTTPHHWTAGKCKPR